MTSRTAFPVMQRPSSETPSVLLLPAALQETWRKPEVMTRGFSRPDKETAASRPQGKVGSKLMRRFITARCYKVKYPTPDLRLRRNCELVTNGNDLCQYGSCADVTGLSQLYRLISMIV